MIHGGNPSQNKRVEKREIGKEGKPMKSYWTGYYYGSQFHWKLSEKAYKICLRMILLKYRRLGWLLSSSWRFLLGGDNSPMSAWHSEPVPVCKLIQADWGTRDLRKILEAEILNLAWLEVGSHQDSGAVHSDIWSLGHQEHLLYLANQIPSWEFGIKARRISIHNAIGSVAYKLWACHLPYYHTVILTEEQGGIVIYHPLTDGTQSHTKRLTL